MHTPGPWSVGTIRNYQRREHLEGAAIQTSDVMVAEVRGATVINGVPMATHIANALLIAAAPDLLEAAELQEEAEEFNANDCTECDGEGVPETCGRCFPKFDAARVARRAAIAKAKGQS